MTIDEQRRRAEAFLALHTARELLVLPNAWDVVSARIIENEGFKAIATTSAGVAATLGYPDGEHMSAEENAAVVRRIAQHVAVPVTADAEAGYGTSPEGVAKSIELMVRAGAVGVNLEDGTGDPAKPLLDPSEHVERIKAVREMARSHGIPLVINARTDAYMLPDTQREVRLSQCIQRANVYRQAGADCIFVPDWGDIDAAQIKTLVNEIDAPLNIIVGDQTPPISELEEIGVARLSLGSKPMRAAMAHVRAVVREGKTTGVFKQMLAISLSYSEVNELFKQNERQ